MEYQKKFYDAELLNHALKHRLNKSVIVITGFSTDFKDFSAVVIALCAHLNCTMCCAGLHNVIYIKKRVVIVFTFDQVALRDKILLAYFKQKQLKL